MRGLTIGQLAKKAQVNVETVRYYERRGLMPEPARRQSGYRQYFESDLARIQFIRRAKELGFSLKEILELLSLRIDPETTCADIKNRAELKIADIEGKIRTLRSMKSALAKLVASCRGRGPTVSARYWRYSTQKISDKNPKKGLTLYCSTGLYRFYQEAKGGEVNEMDVSTCHPLFRVWRNKPVLSVTLNCFETWKGWYTAFRPFLLDFFWGNYLSGILLLFLHLNPLLQIGDISGMLVQSIRWNFR